MTRKDNKPTSELTINLPTALVDKLHTTAQARGVDVDTMVRLALARITNTKYRFLDLKTPFPMGKYRGELLETVIRVDPDYVNWALMNVESLEISDEAKRLLDQIEHVTAIVDLSE